MKSVTSCLPDKTYQTQGVYKEQMEKLSWAVAGLLEQSASRGSDIYLEDKASDLSFNKLECFSTKSEQAAAGQAHEASVALTRAEKRLRSDRNGWFQQGDDRFSERGRNTRVWKDEAERTIREE